MSAHFTRLCIARIIEHCYIRIENPLELSIPFISIVNRSNTAAVFVLPIRSLAYFSGIIRPYTICVSIK